MLNGTCFGSFCRILYDVRTISKYCEKNDTIILIYYSIILMSSTSFGIIWYSLWVFDMLVLWYIHCKITITIGPMCVIIHIRLSSIISDQFTNPIRSLRFRHDVAVSSIAAVDSILPIQRHIGYFFSCILKYFILFIKIVPRSTPSCFIFINHKRYKKDILYTKDRTVCGCFFSGLLCVFLRDVA